MKRAQFTNAEVAAAADEFQTYMAPRTVEASGKNGSVTVYGENPNTYKPALATIDNGEENGILQELGIGDTGTE